MRLMREKLLPAFMLITFVLLEFLLILHASGSLKLYSVEWTQNIGGGNLHVGTREAPVRLDANVGSSIPDRWTCGHGNLTINEA